MNSTIPGDCPPAHSPGVAHTACAYIEGFAHFFAVVGVVPDGAGGQAMYALAEPAVTGRDGRYFVRVEQLAGVFAPDSVLLAVSARSLRMMDRLPDGSSRFVRRDVWAKFGKPPAQPTGLSVDIVVPLTP